MPIWFSLYVDTLWTSEHALIQRRQGLKYILHWCVDWEFKITVPHDYTLIMNLNLLKSICSSKCNLLSSPISDRIFLSFTSDLVFGTEEADSNMTNFPPTAGRLFTVAKWEICRREETGSLHHIFYHSTAFFLMHLLLLKFPFAVFNNFLPLCSVSPMKCVHHVSDKLWYITCVSGLLHF